jgi:rhodanese-related sulfurtransferase
MLKHSAKQLVAEASATVQPLAAPEAAKLVGNPGVLFVDVREPPEVASSGLVAGAINVPRGLLEFQADPESPTYRAELAQGHRLVLYCGSGARSALAAKTLQDMGIENVSHVPGGFAALKAAGAATRS